MNLSNAIAAEEGSTDSSTTTTTEDTSIPHESNETAEGYALFANSASLVEAMSMKVFGNDPVYSHIEWGDDLEDYQRITEETDLNGQQKLDLLHKLTKATFGGRQSEMNEGYGMGWDTDETPPKVYDNDEVDHVPYLDVHSELPSFDHETLDAGEIEQLESEGLDMDDFGFDRSVEGPQLPKINGERVPILFEEGGEVTKMLKMLDSIDLEEVTYCPENGSLQGTPSLSGDDDEDTGKAAETTTDVNLAANPEAIKEFNVNEIRTEVTGITNLRAVQTMLRVESDSTSPRSSVIKRLKERRNAIQSSDEDDEEVATDGGSEEEDDEEISLSDSEMNLASTLIEAGKADDLEDAAEQIRSL